MIKWEAKILDNFRLREARCHGSEGDVFHYCGKLWLIEELCEALDAVRRNYGDPVRVNSWSRCEAHNKAVGGVWNSYHLNGRAVDIQPRWGDTTQLDVLETCARYEFPFVKRYATFIHCDIRGERPS